MGKAQGFAGKAHGIVDKASWPCQRSLGKSAQDPPGLRKVGHPGPEWAGLFRV